MRFHYSLTAGDSHAPLLWSCYVAGQTTANLWRSHPCLPVTWEKARFLSLSASIPNTHIVPVRLNCSLLFMAWLGGTPRQWKNPMWVKPSVLEDKFNNSPLGNDLLLIRLSLSCLLSLRSLPGSGLGWMLMDLGVFQRSKPSSRPGGC